jgi:CRP-like cAMP-binding protein
MPIETRSPESQNQLLASLAEETLKRLRPYLQKVRLEHGHTLYRVDDQVEFAYFPLRGCMVSLLATSEDGDTAEVGVTGYEGVVAIHSVLGSGIDNTFRLPGAVTGRSLEGEGRSIAAGVPERF